MTTLQWTLFREDCSLRNQKTLIVPLPVYCLDNEVVDGEKTALLSIQSFIHSFIEQDVDCCNKNIEFLSVPKLSTWLSGGTLIGQEMLIVELFWLVGRTKAADCENIAFLSPSKYSTSPFDRTGCWLLFSEKGKRVTDQFKHCTLDRSSVYQYPERAGQV